MNVAIEMYQLPILQTNSESPKFEVVLKGVGNRYETESLYEKLQYLYNKKRC